MNKFPPIEIGKKYNELVVLGKSHRNENYTWFYKCMCSCGKETTVAVTVLNSGNTKTCGDLTVHKRKHGHCVGFTISSEYETWISMKKRCLNPKNKDYPNYGGRGIKICSEWLESFKKFIDYMGQKPTPKHSINRINNEGNYEPGNVEWATSKTQNNNRRKRRKKKK